MMTGIESPVLAQTDFGELIPFLIFVFVILGRFLKMFSDRARNLDERTPREVPSPEGDPAEALRKFLAGLRGPQGPHQEPVPPVRTEAPPPPPRAAPRPLRTGASGSSGKAVRLGPAAAAQAEEPPLRRIAAGKPPAPPPAPPPPPAASSRRAAAQSWQGVLQRNPAGLREAVVLREILGPPVVLRKLP